jgi:hypothetical protein
MIYRPEKTMAVGIHSITIPQYRPTKQIGGDYYNTELVPENILRFNHYRLGGRERPYYECNITDTSFMDLGYEEPFLQLLEEDKFMTIREKNLT